MLLPTPPSLKEIQAHTPSINQLPEGTHRPFWSVMIPTYNCGDYLRRTLESVLCQDPGPDDMQIEVVDGCSTKDDSGEVVKKLGRGRVTFHRLAANHGPAHTFNTCIERSRGHWVHILHGDDMVLPDFYEAYATAIRTHPEARMVFGQVMTIDEDDRWIGLFGAKLPTDGGIFTDFVETQATRQLVLFPGIVVHRNAYERVGGFCTLFDHVTDWDMWFRLGQFARVACIPKPYALYRIHSGSDTSRLMVAASNIRESYFIVKANLARLSKSAPDVEEQPWCSRLATAAETTAWRLDSLNCTEGRYNQALWAWMLEPTTQRLLMLLKSWLKHKLKEKTSDFVQNNNLCPKTAPKTSEKAYSE